MSRSFFADASLTAVGAVVLSALNACGDSGTSGAGGAGGAAVGCLPCDAPTALAKPENEDVKEVSGLVASVTQPGIFYAHNDAGDSARFFALGEDGADHGTYLLDGRTAIDFEDAASGPCADAAMSCLYFGDIGDNDETRSGYVVYRVAEPTTTSAGVRTVVSEAFPFVYPDGPHDSEAMFVDPASGTIVIVTKDKKGASAFAYRPPLKVDETVTLEALGEVNVPDLEPIVTGASMRHDGSGLLLRTQTEVWFYEVGGSGFEAALTTTPCSLPAPDEPQAEAIAWQLDGGGFRTMSEGKSEPLVGVACQ